MAELRHPERAHIFILKLWQEVLSDEQNHKQIEWRGRIQDVFNGETHYFRDWPTIVKFISNILPELDTRRRGKSRRRVEGTVDGNGRTGVATAARRRSLAPRE